VSHSAVKQQGIGQELGDVEEIQMRPALVNGVEVAYAAAQEIGWLRA
jgi:hypothetical protein